MVLSLSYHLVEVRLSNWFTQYCVCVCVTAVTQHRSCDVWMLTEIWFQVETKSIRLAVRTADDHPFMYEREFTWWKVFPESYTISMHSISEHFVCFPYICAVHIVKKLLKRFAQCAHCTKERKKMKNKINRKSHNFER